jgi:epoxyqueuosine reductase
MTGSTPDLDRLRALALEAGFSDAGLVALPHPNQDRDARRFEDWIAAGRAGAMLYLERATETADLVRARVATPFPWARSAIVCFARYDAGGPRSTAEAKPGSGWIARYAWTSRRHADGIRRPSDYHKVLLKRLKTFDLRLREECGNFESRAYVDTGPVVERSLAVAAALGWTGKNTCLIHPRLGSQGFLAVLLTSLPVEEEKAPPALVPDRCGTCRRCIDACPTGALTAPYQMDARRCISYLTIEHKGPIAENLMEKMGRQIFGCDICQDVCPWALRAINPSVDPLVESDLEPRQELENPSLVWLAGFDEARFEEMFNGSPVRRAGFNGLRRNIAIAMGNSGIKVFAARLDKWAEDPDEGLRAAARWARTRLGD